MNLVSSILLAAFALSQLEVTYTSKVPTKRYDHYEQHRIPISRSQESEEVEIDTDRKGYSIGSGLRSIAQGSADEANTAVVNQHAAAVQAAYVAKSTLAQSAIQSASTALAALAGKEVLLHSLEHQRDEAAKSLEGELQFLQLSKRANSAAKQTSQQAQNQAAALATYLNNAQALIEFAEASFAESSAQLAKQSEMVGRSKARLESLDHRLKSVKIDFEATKEAAEKAAQSASEAQNNANAAAQHVAVNFKNNVNEYAYPADHTYAESHEGYEPIEGYESHSIENSS